MLAESSLYAAGGKQRQRQARGGGGRMRMHETCCFFMPWQISPKALLLLAPFLVSYKKVLKLFKLVAKHRVVVYGFVLEALYGAVQRSL